MAFEDSSVLNHLWKKNKSSMERAVGIEMNTPDLTTHEL